MNQNFKVINKNSAALFVKELNESGKLFTVDGVKCKNRKSLISELKSSFQLPNYCEDNWDSVSECIK